MMCIYFTDTDPVYFIQTSSGAEMISSKHVITNNTDMERLGITLLIYVLSRLSFSKATDIFSKAKCLINANNAM